MIFPICYFWTVLIVITFSSFNSNFAQDVKTYDEKSLIDPYFNNLYNFSFRQADSLVLLMSKSDMDRASFYNIKANLSWWKLLSGDSNNPNLKECNLNINESIKLNLKNTQRNISSLLNIIYSYSLKARLENYSGNKLKSLIYFYKSIGYISECTKISGHNEEVNLLLGLYFYLIDYIENEYYLMNALLLFSFPNGNKIKGLEYLKNCSTSKNEMVRTEANYFLFKIYFNLEMDFKKAYVYVRVLNELHPENLVYNLEHLKLLIILKKSGEAEVYREILIQKIQTAENINTFQKKNLSQIDQVTETGF